MNPEKAEIDVRIVAATERETPLILRMLVALAEYERLSHKVAVTEAGLRKFLFGSHPAAEVALAYLGDEGAGLAIFFPTFSTFSGEPGLYLEDLFVEPRWRRRGLGRRLMAHVAAVAASRGCRTLSWSVLRWNEPAIEFYSSMGAEPLEEWAGFRLTGEAFGRLLEAT